MNVLPENNADNPDEYLEQVNRLELAIANERVLLAKLKMKRRRLSNQEAYQRMLSAMEHDIARQLARLQNELEKLTHK
ncbi:hypothetical protein [Spirosoma koreense]